MNDRHLTDAIGSIQGGMRVHGHLLQEGGCSSDPAQPQARRQELGARVHPHHSPVCIHGQVAGAQRMRAW